MSNVRDTENLMGNQTRTRFYQVKKEQKKTIIVRVVDQTLQTTA